MNKCDCNGCESQDKCVCDDKCPVCQESPEVCGYSVISGGMLMMLCCKRCGVIYIPKSLREAMSEVEKKKDSRIITPGMVAVGPNKIV